MLALRAPAELVEQRPRREGPMRMLGLPGVTQLRHGALLADRDEHRVEPEAFAAGRGTRDLAAQHSRADDLRSVRRERDELADVLCATIVDAVESREQLLDMAALRPPCGHDPGRAAERRHLDPRVIGEHPPAGRADRPAETSLAARIVEIRLAVLGWELDAREQLQIPLGEQLPELRQLVRVPGADRRVQRRHFTPTTKSRS